MEHTNVMICHSFYSACPSQLTVGKKKTFVSNEAISHLDQDLQS